MTRTKCEVYSRVVGYIRPVSNWNDSKQAEFSDRIAYDDKGKVYEKKHRQSIVRDVQTIL